MKVYHWYRSAKSYDMPSAPAGKDKEALVPAVEEERRQQASSMWAAGRERPRCL